MIKIRIRTVKKGYLKYNRVGDWHWEDPETLLIWVEDRSNEKHEWLVAAHEFIEALLCRMAGVTEESIDAFDEEVRGEWVASGPGYREHLVAEGVEKILAALINVNWDKYEEEICGEKKEEGGTDQVGHVEGLRS